MVRLEVSLKVTESPNPAMVGVDRVLKGRGTVGSQSGWGGRVLKGHRIMRFYSGWGGKVLKGHGIPEWLGWKSP